MKTNRKLQLLAAATVAMLAINPAARAQTPAPLSDEMLLHALATGQIPTSQLGAGGGDDEKRAASASPGTPSIIVGGIGIDFAATESYGGGLYLQGGTAPNYGGGVYNTTADSQPFLGWYNDVYNVAAAQGSVAGFKDADGTAADLHTTDDYGGGLYLQGQPAASQLGVGGGNDDALLQQPGVISVYPGLYYGDVALQNNGPATAAYGGAMYYGGGVYNTTASSPPVNSWYNDFYGNVSAPNPNSGFTDSDGTAADLHATTTTTYGGVLYIQGQPTVSYGGAIYRSTASSLVGEDFPGDALVGEDFPGDALWGEDLPGEALTDAQLDALIFRALAGFYDQDDNCPVAPVRR